MAEASDDHAQYQMKCAFGRGRVRADGGGGIIVGYNNTSILIYLGIVDVIIFYVFIL